MDHIDIRDTALSVDEVTSLVTSPTSGAVSLFVGTTRNNFNGRTVVRLEYEAYVPMARRELANICSSIRQQWPSVENIAMHHRLGLVPICEASVIVAVSSPHRAAALEATTYAIDTLKASVPIWKKEVYQEGEPQWKENTECTWKTDTNS